MYIHFVVVTLLTVATHFKGSHSQGISPFPETAGPYYGYLLNTKAASRRRLIPTSATGTCEKGTIYNITRPEDLNLYVAELQCIFAAAITPSRVPAGPQKGRVIASLNSRTFVVDPVVNLVWRGNYAFKAQCNNSDTEPVYIGFHNALGRSVLPCLLYIAPLRGQFAPGEYEDMKDSVIMDFTQDLSKVCKDYGDFVRRNLSSLPVALTSLANVYPQTQVFDVFRLVGRQRDGGKIYLGKTYLRDYYRDDYQMATIAFWYIINYDKEVNPEFKIGQSLPPLKEDFKYTFPGVVDIVLRYLPIDNLIYRPLQTIWKFNSGVRNFRRSMRINAGEYLRQIGSRGSNRRRLRKYWETGGRKGRNFEDVFT